MLTNRTIRKAVFGSILSIAAASLLAFGAGSANAATGADALDNSMQSLNIQVGTDSLTAFTTPGAVGIYGGTDDVFSGIGVAIDPTSVTIAGDVISRDTVWYGMAGITADGVPFADDGADSLTAGG